MDFFKQNIIPGEVIVQLLAFLIVFFVLKALAWKPILGSLQARREKIKKSFEDIESARQEIEQMKTEYSERLKKIEEEARTKLQEAISEGQKISREIQEKARSDAQEAFEKSKENITLEVAKARVTLRREIADLSISVAEKILKETMSDKKQEEKVLEMIEELEKA